MMNVYPQNKHSYPLWKRFAGGLVAICMAVSFSSGVLAANSSSTPSSSSSTGGGAVEVPGGPGADVSTPNDPSSTSNMVVTSYRLSWNGPWSTPVKEIKKGDSVDIEFTIKNVGLYTSSIIRPSVDLDITKALDSFKWEGTPVIEPLNKSMLTFRVTFKGAVYTGNGKNFNFVVSYPGSKFAADNAQITINECVEYKEPEKGEPTAPLVQIGRSEIGAPLQPNQGFPVTVTLTNLSQKESLENITAVFEPSDGLVLMENTASKMIPYIGVGQTENIVINLQTAKDLTAASQGINVSLKYTSLVDGKRVSGEASEKVVIPVVANKSTEGGTVDSATPNIIISHYSYGEQIAAGDTFDLELEFTNTSKVNQAENIVMSLETGEGLTITSSSNTSFFVSLAPGATQKQTIQMQALPNAKPESPKIDISFKYEYVDGEKRNQVTNTEKIAIPVFQPDRFELTPPTAPLEAFLGEETSISIPYVNKGKSEVSNVEASLSGNVQLLEEHQNLGNFESGKSGSIDFIATPTEIGEQELLLTIQYEDSSMKVKTVDIPIKLNVGEPMMDPGIMDPGMEEPEKSSPPIWLFILIGVVVVGAGITVFLVIRKKKKKKANAFEDQFNWEEIEDLPEITQDDQEQHQSEESPMQTEEHSNPTDEIESDQK